MSKHLNPDDKVIRGGILSDKTNAQFLMGDLTPEVLRDIARNEAASREWRKAAVKFLLTRGHIFVNHHDFSELLAEIKSEQEAELEVQAIVESATERPLEG